MTRATTPTTAEHDAARADARTVLLARIDNASCILRTLDRSATQLASADPLGDEGRAALAALGDRRLDQVIGEWAKAHNEYWHAVHALAALAADDRLRAGRHQRIFEAGIRWRTRVVSERRAELVAATRTARRAVGGP